MIRTLHAPHTIYWIYQAGCAIAKLSFGRPGDQQQGGPHFERGIGADDGIAVSAAVSVTAVLAVFSSNIGERHRDGGGVSIIMLTGESLTCTESWKGQQVLQVTTRPIPASCSCLSFLPFTPTLTLTCLLQLRLLSNSLVQVGSSFPLSLFDSFLLLDSLTLFENHLILPHYNQSV